MTSSLSLSGISGYDFSGVTTALISRYSAPLTKMQSSLNTLQTKQSAWQDLNTRLSALENTLADLKKASTWTGTSVVSSNTAVLSATSNSSALTGTYSIEVIRMATGQTAVSDVQEVASASDPTSIGGGTFNITVGSNDPVEITVAAGASLKDIAAAINEKGIGVNASVVKGDNGYQLALFSAQTGKENAFILTETEGSVLYDLGLTTAEGTLKNVQEAQDAELKINGLIQVTSSSNTVTTAIDGVTLTLNQDTGTTKLIVSEDYTSAQKAVQAFVDQYNSLQSLLEKNLAYNKDTGVKGVFLGDPTVQSIQSRLRSILASTMGYPDGTFNILADVGIDTSSDNFGKSARLVFDTAKFTEAMQKDAHSVANLFGAKAGGVTPVTETDDEQQAQGLANILKEYLHPLVKYGGLIDQTKTSFDDQIREVKSRISDFQEKISAYTERITNQYAALEAQLSALNSENAYITSMLNSLSILSNYGANKQ